MPGDRIYGLLMGTFGHQIMGKQTFTDEANGIVAKLEYNAYMFKKQDYFWGEIFQHGSKVCEITGNYTGHLDFDGVRYWDYREGDTVNYPIVQIDPEECLPSDARLRTDSIYLRNRPVEEAQTEKERLENIQRNDRSLREESEKRRQSK